MTDTWERRNVPVTDGYNNPEESGGAVTYPVITSICSPDPDTIRFEGTGFLNATVGPVASIITRLADYSSGPELDGPTMQYDLVDGSPDASGWSLVTHTDTVLEISNPAFTSAEPNAGPGDFVVTGAAFHSADLVAMYFYEPWGETFSTPVDGAGCAEPEILTYDSGTDTLTITDVGGNFTALVDLVAFWSYTYPIEAYAPDVVYDSPTQVRVLNATSLGFDPGGSPSYYIHHVAVVEDSATDYPNTVVFEADVDFDEFENLNYPSVHDATSPAADRLQLDGVRFLTGATQVLNQIQVVSDAGANRNYYDPAGPDAALNPVGATIISWTDTQVIIDDPGLSGYEQGIIGNIHGGDSRGYLRLYGGTNAVPVEVQRFIAHPHFTIA